METGGSMPHSQRFSNNLYPEPIPIPRTDTDFFKVNFNIFLSPKPCLSKGLFSIGLPIKQYYYSLPLWLHSLAILIL